MDQNIESEILEKRKLCKVLKVFKIVSFIGIFAPFVAFMVVSRNGYELDSAWLLIPALFVGGFFLFSYMETNKLKDLKELMGQYVVRSVLGERLHVIEYMPNGYTNEAFLHNCPILATVYKGNIIKNLIMDCQSYTKYRPNETTGGIFVSWRRKEELPTGA